MGDFDVYPDFHESLRRILDGVDLSIDQRLEQLVALLSRLEPDLLEVASEWADEEIAKAFLEFLNPTDTHQEGREERFIAALVGAAELQRRAHQAGLDVMRYAHLVRVRRELGDA